MAINRKHDGKLMGSSRTYTICMLHKKGLLKRMQHMEEFRFMNRESGYLTKNHHNPVLLFGYQSSRSWECTMILCLLCSSGSERIIFERLRTMHQHFTMRKWTRRNILWFDCKKVAVEIFEITCWVHCV